MKIEGYACEHPTVAGKPCVICETHYPQRADDQEVARIMALPDEEVKAELIKDGLDPEQVAADMKAAVQRAIKIVDQMDPRLRTAILLWGTFARNTVEDWQDETHKAEYLMAVDRLPTGLLFNLLLSRFDFDGMDPRTFSLSEMERAIKGATWPPYTPSFSPHHEETP